MREAATAALVAAFESSFAARALADPLQTSLGKVPIDSG